jgi:hypothetical protein
LHIIKTHFPEALWKCTWIHYHQCVEEVKEAKRMAVEAVRARKNAATAKSASDFGQQSIL